MNDNIQRNVLIIGASSGIGKKCAEVLANENSRLYLVARNEEAMKKLQQELPGKIKVIVYDLNDTDGIKTIFDQIKEDKCKLDALIYSAGVDAFAPAKVTSQDMLKRTMNVNCFAFCEVARKFFNRQISVDGAAIVAISSIASLLNSRGQMAYTVSKSALNSAVKTMAQEFSSRQIRVNAVLPAGVNTQMAMDKGAVVEGLEADVSNASVKKEVPVQFLGMIPPDVVANNVKFLLSENSAFTTGELLTIGAGYQY